MNADLITSINIAVPATTGKVQGGCVLKAEAQCLWTALHSGFWSHKQCGAALLLGGSKQFLVIMTFLSPLNQTEINHMFKYLDCANE